MNFLQVKLKFYEWASTYPAGGQVPDTVICLFHNGTHTGNGDLVGVFTDEADVHNFLTKYELDESHFYSERHALT